LWRGSVEEFTGNGRFGRGSSWRDGQNVPSFPKQMGDGVQTMELGLAMGGSVNGLQKMIWEIVDG
jgi:hypothetical protein